MELKYRTQERTTELNDRKEAGLAPVLQSKLLNETGLVKNGFSTRLGGVSTGIWESMNLNFGRGDDEAAVLKNFQIFARSMDTSVERMVYSMQTHTTNVRRVGKEDCGNGILTPQKFVDVDGLITDEPGVCLVTTYADCVPLYFVDVQKKAIGLSHSGWRGTVNHMAQKTVQLMKQEFGCEPADIKTFVGPSICRECYEVSEDVAEEFRETYAGYQSEIVVNFKRKDGNENKYLLDLHAANVFNLLDAGILPGNISVTDLCTCCNPQMFYSHRASHGKRGGLCAFLELK